MGKINLIIGCMYSGKTSELQKRYKRDVISGLRCIIIKHVLDDRYNNDEKITTHDNIQIQCLKIKQLSEFMETAEYKNADNIYIDEGQFFHGLKKFVIQAVEIHNKNITISGLDGDFNRDKFGEIIDLIPYSDSICKLTAICCFCKNGTPAIFSKRIINHDDVQINVGALDKYVAVCRKHYLNT